MVLEISKGQAMTHEKLYSVEEAANYFGVSKTTIYNWIRQDGLQFKVRGRRKFFSQENLDGFIRPGSVEQDFEDLRQKNIKPAIAA